MEDLGEDLLEDLREDLVDHQGHALLGVKVAHDPELDIVIKNEEYLE